MGNIKIIKNICHKFKIHFFTYIIILISLITGRFKEVLTFLYIVMFHELGHILTGIFFKWEIDNILLLPFGCITFFKTNVNKPFKEEVIVSISGLIFQLINFIIFKDVTTYFNYYNYGLFIFNLLPIYPLDGYKIFSVFLAKYIPYKKTLKTSLIVSLLLLTIFIKKDLIYIVILLLLLKGIVKEYGNINNIYNRFLLERSMNRYYFKKNKKILRINDMYKYHYNLIKKDRLYTEDEILKNRFKKKL